MEMKFVYDQEYLDIEENLIKMINDRIQEIYEKIHPSKSMLASEEMIIKAKRAIESDACINELHNYLIKLKSTQIPKIIILTK